MQRFWKVLLEGKGCTEKQVVAMQLRLSRGTRAATLDAVRFRMAELGYTNGGGEPYSRERIRQFVREGFRTAVLTLADRAPRDEKRFCEAAEALLRQKVHYSRSTEHDPYLKGRLEWWHLRKTGRKPNSSTYDQRTR
jgi:hypothetical protein